MKGMTKAKKHWLLVDISLTQPALSEMLINIRDKSNFEIYPPHPVDAWRAPNLYGLCRPRT